MTRDDFLALIGIALMLFLMKKNCIWDYERETMDDIAFVIGLTIVAVIGLLPLLASCM